MCKYYVILYKRVDLGICEGYRTIFHVYRKMTIYVSEKNTYKDLIENMNSI
jgi:hypothetical protein